MTYLMPIDELRRLYEREGLTTTEIGEIFGCPHYIIAYKLRKAGTTMRRRGKRNYTIGVPIEDLVKRYNSGEGLVELSKDAGSSANKVRKELANAGVKIRKPGNMKSIKRWDRDMRKELRRAYNHLGSYELAGRQFGISRQRVHQILKNYRPGRGRKTMRKKVQA